MRANLIGVFTRTGTPTVSLRSRLAACTLAGLATVFGPVAQAQVPLGITYQGYLTDAAGQPVEGPVNAVFRAYTVPTGGSPLWTENISVLPEQGLFLTELGVGTTPFPAGLFETPVWIGITLGNDAEMTPRRALKAAPYAWQADNSTMLAGLPESFYARSADLSALSGQVGLNADAINALDTQADSNTNSISSLTQTINDNAADISGIQQDVSAAQSDINSIESTLPGLQNRVSGACTAGSSIRSIGASGTVTCEPDDSG
ncbi:MAG: hypothetical protein AAFU65_14760, partial [Pseudomonadota bacterium]